MKNTKKIFFHWSRWKYFVKIWKKSNYEKENIDEKYFFIEVKNTKIMLTKIFFHWSRWKYPVKIRKKIVNTKNIFRQSRWYLCPFKRPLHSFYNRDRGVSATKLPWNFGMSFRPYFKQMEVAWQTFGGWFPETPILHSFVPFPTDFKVGMGLCSPISTYGGVLSYIFLYFSSGGW